MGNRGTEEIAKAFGYESPGEDPRASPAPQTPPERRLYLILAILVTGFFVSLFYHYEAAVVDREQYPYSTFLFTPDDQFMDFYNNFVALKAEGPLSVHVGWGSALGTLRARLLYQGFYPKHFKLTPKKMKLPSYKGPFLAWAISTAIFLAAITLFVRNTVASISPDFLWVKTLVLTLCSYPVLFCVDRSNFEESLFVWLAIAIFLYRQGSYFWSAAFVGAAIAAKPYTVVFLVLFLSDRRWKEMFAAIGVMGVVTLVALALLPGNTFTRLAALQKSMAEYNQLYVAGNYGLPFGDSLYGLAKVVIYKTHWFVSDTSDLALALLRRRLMIDYFRFAVVAFSGVSLLVLGVRMKLWQKVALLVSAMNLLPFVCADYRLIHLFIPLFLFLREEEPVWGDKFYCIVFALLLMPKGFLYFSFDPVFLMKPLEVSLSPLRNPLLCVSESVVLNPLLMLALSGGIAFAVLRRARASEAALWLLDAIKSRTRGQQPQPASA